MARLGRFRQALLWLPLLLLFAAVPASGRTLFAVQFDDPLPIVELEDGARVRFLTKGEALIEGEEGLGEALRLRAVAAERVTEIDDREALFIAYPRSAGTRLGRAFEVLWRGPHDEVLVACDPRDVDVLLADSFAAYSLPERIDARSWFDVAPPRHVVDRPPDRDLALRWQVTDVIESISVDSLMAHVRRLTTYPDGSLRTRYTRREECITEGREYILDRLEASLPVGSLVDTQRFLVGGYTCDDGPAGPYIDYPADNVIGVLSGTESGNGYYVVSAHYDATAAHSFKGRGYYWWCDNPAPGADDNGTGVAATLEIARVLTEAGVSFPFDVRFIFFSGEELGLYGSQAYANAAAARGDTIYGVLNVDMIAFKRSESDPDTCHIMANASSSWISDWLVETADDVYPSHFEGFDVTGFDLGIAYSDHASFWARGYDAVTTLEHYDPRVRNPYYHTLQDTMATVSPSQFLATTRMVAASLARLADPSPQVNLAIQDGGIDISGDLVTGETVDVVVRTYSFGAESQATVTVELWDGEPDAGDLIGTRSGIATVGAGRVLDRSFEWQLTSAELGDHTLWARVSAEGLAEASTTDNASSLSFRVDGRGLYVAWHHVRANPVRSMGDLAFTYELSRDGGGVLIEVYDLLGQRLGKCDLRGGPAVEAGVSEVAWDEFDEATSGLAGGLYIYRVVTYERGSSDPSDEVFGKFAVLE